MKLEIRTVDIKSVVLSAFPLTVFCLAVIGGFVTFFVIDNPQYAMMSAMNKTISVAVYAIVYMLMMLALSVFAVFLYNFLGAVLGLRGITINLEETAEFVEQEEAEEAEEEETDQN